MKTGDFAQSTNVLIGDAAMWRRIRRWMVDLGRSFSWVFAAAAKRCICSLGKNARSGLEAMPQAQPAARCRASAILGHRQVGETVAGMVDRGNTMPGAHLPEIRTRRSAWNKGRTVGQKPLLEPTQVRTIRARLEIAQKTREPVPLQSRHHAKLRGCDRARQRGADVYAAGLTKHGASSIESMTREPVRRAKDDKSYHFVYFPATRLGCFTRTVT